MAGAGVPDTRMLSAAPASLNFGSVATGKSESLSVKLENTGNSSVTVSGITVSGVNLTTARSRNCFRTDSHVECDFHAGENGDPERLCDRDEQCFKFYYENRRGR